MNLPGPPQTRFFFALCVPLASLCGIVPDAKTKLTDKIQLRCGVLAQ